MAFKDYPIRKEKKNTVVFTRHHRKQPKVQPCVIEVEAKVTPRKLGFKNHTREKVPGRVNLLRGSITTIMNNSKDAALAADVGSSSSKSARKEAKRNRKKLKKQQANDLKFAGTSVSRHDC